MENIGGGWGSTGGWKKTGGGTEKWVGGLKGGAVGRSLEGVGGLVEDAFVISGEAGVFGRGCVGGLFFHFLDGVGASVFVGRQHVYIDIKGAGGGFPVRGEVGGTWALLGFWT